jgi:hypothetical protein
LSSSSERIPSLLANGIVVFVGERTRCVCRVCACVRVRVRVRVCVCVNRPVLVAELEYALERGDALLTEAPRPRVVENGGRVEHCSLSKVEDLVHVQKALGAALYTRLHFLSHARPGEA